MNLSFQLPGQSILGNKKDPISIINITKKFGDVT
jgi:hypothetical protein